MTVKAKFKCESVTKFGAQEDVKLTPVTGGSDENKSFSKYTPSGKLELSITNEALFGHFQPGQEYYLEINAA
jgi:hypothetical protein